MNLPQTRLENGRPDSAELSELLATITHELRSPLARANMAVGIIEDNLPPVAGEAPAEDSRTLVTKYLAVLQEELSHMDALIETMLLTHKVQSSSSMSVDELVDFSACCEEMCSRYQVFFGRNRLGFNHNITPGLVVTGNTVLLKQLISNLLDNALKYTSEHGGVWLNLGLRRGAVYLTLENTCDNIAADELDAFFAPFYQLEAGQAKPGPRLGLGLGLALVQSTAALHGGDSMAVLTDKGICICVLLSTARESQDD